MSGALKVQVLGQAEMDERLQRINLASRKYLSKELTRWAIKAHKSAVDSIQGGTKTGHEYRKGKGGKIAHRASAPGEAPATDTGELVRGLRVMPSNEHTLSAFVASTAPYSWWLEFGTSQMAARPFMHPAFKATAPDSIKGAAIAITKGLRTN